jgi:hypothetical protein
MEWLEKQERSSIATTSFGAFFSFTSGLTSSGSQ